MKNRLSFLLNALVIISCAVGYSQTDSLDFRKVSGFSHPESVVLDPLNKLLYVSNIGENSKADGFISKLSVDGNILELKWITGLTDPKGLLVKGEKLYVTDLTEVVEMDIEKGKITKKYQPENAKGLNDIAADDAGNLYISDTGKSSVYKIDSQGNTEEWLHSPDLESPNGLLFSDGNLWVAAWGSQGEKGNILKIDTASKGITQVSDNGIGNLDGLQQNAAKEFYFSDWMGGKIYKIDSDTNFSEVVTAAKSVGDILLMEEENLLVLPMNLQNEVWWYQLP